MVWVMLLCARPGFCDSGVELLLEQSPVDGGSLDLGTGVHEYAPGSQITITAMPQSGFRFSYWLGDVSDPTSTTTTIRLDESRAVIAVYEPIVMGLGEEELLTSSGGGGGGGGGGSRLSTSAIDFYFTTFSAGGGGLPQGTTGQNTVINVPEPTTIALLGLGGLVLARKKRKTKI